MKIELNLTEDEALLLEDVLRSDDIIGLPGESVATRVANLLQETRHATVNARLQQEALIAGGEIEANRWDVDESCFPLLKGMNHG